MDEAMYHAVADYEDKDPKRFQPIPVVGGLLDRLVLIVRQRRIYILTIVLSSKS